MKYLVSAIMAWAQRRGGTNRGMTVTLLQWRKSAGPESTGDATWRVWLQVFDLTSWGFTLVWTSGRCRCVHFKISAAVNSNGTVWDAKNQMFVRPHWAMIRTTPSQRWGLHLGNTLSQWAGRAGWWWRSSTTIRPSVTSLTHSQSQWAVGF